LREVTAMASGWTYPNGQYLADAALGTLSVTVAQVSDRFGPGPATTIVL
jgi:hypothetical protein